VVATVFAAMADAQSQQASVTPAPASSTEIVFLGTGMPRALPDHQGASLAIIVNGKLYLVDAGTGVVRQANAAYMAGTPASKVEGLNIAFITHVHSDHTLGLPDLIFTPWVIGRTVPLELYGPTGIAAMVSNILKAYEQDERSRINGREGVPGESVLILGATGVTGKLAVRIAKLLGAARVVAAGRNQQVLSTLPELGADATIRLGAPDNELRDAFASAIGSSGFQVVIDYVWGRPVEVLLSAMTRKEFAAAGSQIRLLQVGVVKGGVCVRSGNGWTLLRQAILVFVCAFGRAA
jgi:Metallo-beta-lactamase superfamily/Zinc-binding dehydrogenase